MVEVPDLGNSFKESSPTQEIKNSILNWFRGNNCDVGHVISDKHLLHMSINWNPKKKKAIEGAIKELINEGLIEDHSNGFALTEKGVDHIY